MKKIKSFLTKILLCTIIFLILAIISKKNITYKNKIKYELYENNISFSHIKELYNHYLGGIIPLENINNQKEQTVFNEKINYTNISPYLNGAILEVEKNYPVPNQEEGVVIYIGKKEGYENVIIIDDKKNIETWYGNICNTTLKLYDYIEKGKYIGETCDNHLYMVYSKKGKFLNYKDYLS